MNMWGEFLNKHIKKVIAVISSSMLVVTSLTGCLDDLEDTGDFDETEYFEDEEGAEETDAPVIKYGIPYNAGTKGVKMLLNENGSLEIDRKEIETSVPMGEEGIWTVFVYMCGSDLESIDGMGTMDLEEMTEGSEGGAIRYVVLTGGAGDWFNDNCDPESTGTLLIADGKIRKLEDDPKKNFGSPETLSDFLSYGLSNFASEHMGLVLWDHGGGSIAGVCLDENFDNDSLTLVEIDSALYSGCAGMTDRFEFIGFDACLMSTVEAAYMLATYADYMYASQETESGYGWDYAAMGKYLDDKTEADGLSLGQTVADSFYRSCEEAGQDTDATLSVTDLSKVDALVKGFNEYANELYTATEDRSVLTAMMRNAREADNFGGNNKSEGYTNMADLSGIMEATASLPGVSDKADTVIKLVDDCVSYKKNGKIHKNACGLSIYYPYEIQGSDELTEFGMISISPYYLGFVSRMAYGNAYSGDLDNYDPDAITELWADYQESEDENSCDIFADTWEYYDKDYAPTGESAYIEFAEGPGFDQDGIYCFTLTEDALENTLSVLGNVWKISDDGKDEIFYGSVADIGMDWENGIFEDNFDGYWFSLPDGQNLSVYLESEEDGYDVYSSPVELNGKETNLVFIHDYNNGTAHITGVWDGIDDNGMSGRNTGKLKNGDIIIPLADASDIDSGEEYTYYGDEYEYTGNDDIIFDIMPDGEYLYGFTIDDLYGDYFITDDISLKIDGKDIYYSDL